MHGVSEMSCRRALGLNESCSEFRLELTGLIPFELVKDSSDTRSHTHSFDHGASYGSSKYTWLVSSVRTGFV